MIKAPDRIGKSGSNPDLFKAPLPMTSESLENRRSDIHRLLQDCMDEKVLYGGTANAIAKAEEAYRLAHAESRVPSPWPELAAYRLAHLLLRYESHEAAALEKIDRLLMEASTGGHLGPMPSIYRLAVLHRMQSVAHATNRKRDIQLKIERTINESVEWLRMNRFSDHRDHPLSNVLEDLIADFIVGQTPKLKQLARSGIDRCIEIKQGGSARRFRTKFSRG